MLVILQTDPGVPVVYAGFGALMLTTCISFLSHSQVKFLLLLFDLSALCPIKLIVESKCIDSSSGPEHCQVVLCYDLLVTVKVIPIVIPKFRFSKCTLKAFLISESVL